jgi:hypothetical protein
MSLAYHGGPIPLAGDPETRLFQRANCISVATYSKMASFMFSMASSSVSPCDQQPGKPRPQATEKRVKT